LAVENPMKEREDGLALERPGCTQFLGDQIPALLTLAASMLVHAVREHVTGTACAAPQVATLRERL
jgi:hypothetical protein